MTKAEAACGVAVQNQIAPALEAAVAAILGARGQAWFEFLTDPGTHSPVLHFHYPSSQPGRVRVPQACRQAGVRFVDRVSNRSAAIRCGLGSPKFCPQLSRTGSAKSLPWKWSGASGRKQRSSTRSTTGQPIRRRRIGFPGTTPTRQRWPNTRTPAKQLTCTSFATVSCNGKASSSAAGGRTTTKRNQVHSGSFPRPNACQRYAETTRRCGICTCLIQPASTTS